MSMTRNEFLKSGLALLGVGVSATVLGACGSDDDPAPGGGGAGGSSSGGSSSGGSSSGGSSSGGSSSGGSSSGGSSSGGSSSGGSSSGGSGSGSAGCTASMIVGNHGHELVVPMADVTAAMDKTYSIQGSSGHAHDVTLTAADFGTLGTGSAVTVTSTTGAAHEHEVTVTCA